MTETEPKTRPMPKIGKWRRAGLLRENWQILVVAEYEKTGVEEWLTIEHMMQIMRPFRVASMRLSDGRWRTCPADRESGYEFFTRSPAEQRQADELADHA